MDKLKDFFRYFRFSHLQDTLKTYKQDISIKQFLGMCVVISAIIAAIGYLYYMKFTFIIGTIVTFLFMIPSLLVFRYKASYEEFRFTCVSEYMEQLIYSFNKTNKIRASLADVYSVSNGYIKELVKQMIDVIDYGEMSTDLYLQAFSIIESRYNCQRLKLLHRYLIQVEESGGEYSHSLTILLNDMRKWSSRTLQYQQERRAVQNKISLSIIFALVSAGLMTHNVPQEYRDVMTATNLYQLSTLAIMVLSLCTYYFSSRSVSKSYLDNELDAGAEERYKRQAAFILKKDSKGKGPLIIKLLLMAVAAGGLWYAKIYYGIPFAVIMAGFFVFQDTLHAKSCMKGITKEIKKAFPSWFRNIILYLQTDNVAMSLQTSYDACPAVLQPFLYKMLEEIDENPDSQKPYAEFLSGFDVPSLRLAVSYLYSIQQFGADDMAVQLDYLIEQSEELSIVEEKIRNDDALAGFSMMGLVPMMLASLKLTTDMILFLNIVQSMLGGFI